MTVLSAQTIRKIDIVSPLNERFKVNGMTAGLSCCGVDLTLGENVLIPPKTQINSFVQEKIRMPFNVRGKVENKSTLARIGIDASATTNIEPGWVGFLTVEIYNRSWWFKSFKKGTPICQVVFEFLDCQTDMPYSGRYQNQGKMVQEAIFMED